MQDTVAPIELAIQRRISELYCLAERHFMKRFKRPEVTLTLRGQTAGQAWPGKNLLKLNRVLLEENQQHFIEHTIGHEVAHLIAEKVYGRKIRPHGVEWKYVMEKVFSLPANRTHDYDTKRVSKRPFAYLCGCPDKTIHLSTTRHNRILRGTVYQCVDCKSPLRVKPSIGPSG